MIALTGYDGFIGKNLRGALREPVQLIFDRCSLPSNPLQAIVHLAAISDTMFTHRNAMEDCNFRLPQVLWNYCAKEAIPFIYASSAAVYGDGHLGFHEETFSRDSKQWQPLNLYGEMKLAFDRWALSRSEETTYVPPKWYGLRFFNVYGPHELYKGNMASQIHQQIKRVKNGMCPRFFEGTANSSRDFVFVGDVCDIIKFFIGAKAPSGIYNVGSGLARTFDDVGTIVNLVFKREDNRIDYDIPIPRGLGYQHFTKAPLLKLRVAGYVEPPTALEEGILMTAENWE